ncbi:MAG: putative metallopeptidase [Saprospiraceae bacterium]
MKNIKLPLFGLIASLLFFGCKKDDANEYTVNSDFEEYVQRFIDEGAARGVEIDFSDTGLLIEYSDRIVNGASGYCYLGDHHIVIDKSEWPDLTDTQKEYLIFHELGHCELDRQHKNNQFDNLLWQSLMRGDPLVGTQQNIPVPYYGFRKNYYRDELFNQNTSAPDWSNPNFNINDVPLADKELLIERENIPRIAEAPAAVGDNFEMEFQINGINGVPFITELNWGADSQKFFVRIYRNFGTYIGALENGKDQQVFYHPTKDDLDKITIRQKDGLTQLFFDDILIYHFDELPSVLSTIKLEARDGNNVLVSSFSVEHFSLFKLL